MSHRKWSNAYFRGLAPILKSWSKTMPMASPVLTPVPAPASNGGLNAILGQAPLAPCLLHVMLVAQPFFAKAKITFVPLAKQHVWHLGDPCHISLVHQHLGSQQNHLGANTGKHLLDQKRLKRGYMPGTKRNSLDWGCDGQEYQFLIVLELQSGK